MTENSEHIKVFVRVRPLTIGDTHKTLNVISDQEIALLSNGTAESRYKFNTVFREHIHQDEIYNMILVPIVCDLIQGYNCTLFSCGTTRTDATNGNTSTMNSTSSTPIAPPALTSIPKLPQSTEDGMSSLISCAMYRLFEHLTQLELSSSVRISYLEICDEELVDLLQTNTTTAAQLKIFENDKNHIYVNGLTEMTVHSAAEAIMIFRMAQKNMPSLKSHTIFTISVQSKEKPKHQLHENEGLFKYRRLCLVQLGSQESQKKQSRAKTVQSLTSLSRVVQALISKQVYIPYRDSKLTRIMQESLGGNAKASILATFGSGNSAIEDTTQALDFLNRMKGICNHPKINERLDDARTLNEMALEIRKLMMDIEANRNKTGHFLTDEMYVNYQNEMHITKADLKQRRQEMILVNEQGHDLNGTLSNVNSNLGIKNAALVELQSMASTKQQQLQKVSNVKEFRQNKIERFGAKENQMIEQANLVKSTIGEVLEDKKHLDDCVERYKLADDRFTKAISGFQTDLQQKFHKLATYSNESRTVIDEKLRKIGELEKTFLGDASSFIELIKSKSLALLEKLEGSLKNETDKWDEMKTGFHDILSSHVKSVETNIAIYKEYANKLEQQSIKIDKSYQQLREMYGSHFGVVNRMIDDINERMKSHGANVPELTSAMRSMVAKCANIGGNIDDKMQTIYEQMRELVHQVQRNSDEIKNTVEPALLAAETNVQQTMEAVTDALDTHQIAINGEQFLFTQPTLPENLKVLQTQVKMTLTEKADLVNNLLENVIKNNNAAMKCNRTHCENVSMKIPTKCDIITNRDELEILRNDLNENCVRVSKHGEENATLLNQIVSSAQHMSITLTHQIASSQNQLKHFREMDFCEYQSSGETPSKREYPTEVSLAATTPLDKIKQRFRDRLSQIANTSLNANADYSFLSN